MDRRFLQKLKLVFSAFDILLVNLALLKFRNEEVLYGGDKYMALIFVLNLGWLAFVTKGSNYVKKYVSFLKQHFTIGENKYVIIPAITVATAILVGQAFYSKLFLTSFLSCIALLLSFNRLLYFEIYKYLKRKTFKEDKVMFIGFNHLAMKVIDEMEREGITKKIIGFCEEAENVNELSPYPILGGVRNAIDICKHYKVTEIYSTLTPEKHMVINELIEQAERNCIRFKIIRNFDNNRDLRNNSEHFDNIWVISLRTDPLQKMGNRIIKRLFDIVFSSLIIIFINSWLIPIVAFIIKLESKGPVFFKQLRSGKNNSLFFCYKFRTMYVNSDADKLQALKNDKRITQIGRFLRHTNLDEFPQFFNVLRGEMSVTGPRPHMVKHTNQYSELVEEYMVRHLVKPGITGWAQVNGCRGETKEIYQMQKRVQKDIWYMENWSFVLDLKIMLRTIINTVKGDKNAF